MIRKFTMQAKINEYFDINWTHFPVFDNELTNVAGTTRDVGRTV